ncbi:hypothetical protein AX17_004336 [Amanita inopinata Kibby_2008]|nr:hypothetical protein AX17_004336 [Amanita inopinata Kibby_2008]
MVAASASRLVACTLLLLSLPSTVFARAGSTALRGHGNILDYVDGKPTSFDKANLAFFIIFAIISFLLLCHAAFALFYKRTADQDYRFRVPFILIMVLTLLTMIISFVMGAIVESRIELESVFSPGTYAVLGFMEQVTPVFLYAGLFLLLAYRRNARISPGTGQPVGLTTFGLVEGVVVSVLLLFMLACAIGRTAIIAIPFDEFTQGVINVYNDLYHPYLAVFIALTLLIAFDSIFLWVNRNEARSPRQLILFDNSVLFPMAALIWPLLMIRVLYELADDVALSRYNTQVNFDGILLAAILIRGSTQVIVIALALMFGFPLFKRNVGHVQEWKGPVISA